MTQSFSAPATDPRRGRAYPWIFVAAFLGIIAVNGTMVAFAVSTFSGVETPKHYAEGLAYNQVLDAARAQAALGWRIDLHAAPVATDGDARELELSVTAQDRTGQALDDVQVRALIVRPTRSGLDRDLPLLRVGPGRYRAAATLPQPGAWDIRLVVNRGDQHWQSVKRLSLP